MRAYVGGLKRNVDSKIMLAIMRTGHYRSCRDLAARTMGGGLEAIRGKGESI